METVFSKWIHGTLQAKLTDILTNGKICELPNLTKQVGAAHADLTGQLGNTKVLIGNMLLNEVISFP